MTEPRAPRQAVHGVLLLDKPLGYTSNDALQKCKGLLRALKGGHTGTLDPLATGLLPLCFGAATKFAQVSLDADKRYLATLRLGQTRVGGDREGDVIDESAVNCSADDVLAALARYTGSQQQLPPMHSALKHEGRALYEYARQGIEIEREPRSITIHHIHLVEFTAPLLTIDVRCSKGTYIRTLAEDIGQALGCGAHLDALRRTASGALDISQAISIEAFEALTPQARAARLLPADTLLADWPRWELPPDEAARFITGLRRRVKAANASHLRVYGPDFLGTAHITGGELIASRLLSPPEIAANASLRAATETAAIPA